MVDDPATGPDAFKLQCAKCEKSCQLKNPSKWHTQDHTDEACPVACARRDAARPSKHQLTYVLTLLLFVYPSSLTDDVFGCSGCSGLSSMEQFSMEHFLCSPEQAEVFKTNVVKAMITGCVPFSFVENTFFQDALQSVGVSPLTRREVGGCYLDRIFAAEQEMSSGALAECDYICTSSDA